MRPWILPAVLLAVLPAAAAGEGPEIRRGDAKAYRILGDTKHLPKLDRGDVERTLAATPWQPTLWRIGDDTPAERNGSRQIVEATCDADLVVLGRIESSVPFQHPNGRWVLSAHELAITRVVRTRTPKDGRPERASYVHPSGELTVAGRAVRTTVDRFPPIESDEEALFFLVRIGDARYRTSLVQPPMALRGGMLDAFGVVGPGAAREPGAGLSAREAIQLVGAAICRTEQNPRHWQGPTGDGRLPPLQPRLFPP